MSFLSSFRNHSLSSFKVSSYVRNMSTAASRSVCKSDVVFRSVTLDEAEKVCAFGKREMIRTFAHLYDENDFSSYLKEAYQTIQYEGWIKSGEYVVYGAFLDPMKSSLMGENISSSPDKTGDEVVAYVLAGPCNLPLPADELLLCATRPAGEIKRLYAHPNTFGSGIAEELMRNAMTWLRSGDLNKHRDVYLGVYSENPRAVKFYEKHNFKVCGEYQFVVGKQLDREFIMKNANTFP